MWKPRNWSCKNPIAGNSWFNQEHDFVWMKISVIRYPAGYSAIYLIFDLICNVWHGQISRIKFCTEGRNFQVQANYQWGYQYKTLPYIQFPAYHQWGYQYPTLPDILVCNLRTNEDISIHSCRISRFQPTTNEDISIYSCWISSFQLTTNEDIRARYPGV